MRAVFGCWREIRILGRYTSLENPVDFSTLSGWMICSCRIKSCLNSLLQSFCKIIILQFFPQIFFNLFFMFRANSRYKSLLPDCSKTTRKRATKKLRPFCDFVLWNFDHRNFAFVSAKFLLYWAKWNV